MAHLIKLSQPLPTGEEFALCVTQEEGDYITSLIGNSSMSTKKMEIRQMVTNVYNASQSMFDADSYRFETVPIAYKVEK